MLAHAYHSLWLAFKSLRLKSLSLKASPFPQRFCLYEDIGNLKESVEGSSLNLKRTFVGQVRKGRLLVSRLLVTLISHVPN